MLDEVKEGYDFMSKAHQEFNKRVDNFNSLCEEELEDLLEEG